MKRSQDTADRPTTRRGANPKAVIGLAAAAMVAPLIATVAPQASAAPGDEVVQILSFNDYHGHVEDDTADPFGDPRTGGGEYLSAKLTELRDASRPTTRSPSQPATSSAARRTSPVCSTTSHRSSR